MIMSMFSRKYFVGIVVNVCNVENLYESSCSNQQWNEEVKKDKLFDTRERHELMSFTRKNEFVSVPTVILHVVNELSDK